jgi:hypothetical protein
MLILLSAPPDECNAPAVRREITSNGVIDQLPGITAQG